MARARGEKEEVATAAGKGKGRVDKVSTIVRSCFFPILIGLPAQCCGCVVRLWL